MDVWANTSCFFSSSTVGALCSFLDPYSPHFLLDFSDYELIWGLFGKGLFGKGLFGVFILDFFPSWLEWLRSHHFEGNNHGFHDVLPTLNFPTKGGSLEEACLVKAPLEKACSEESFPQINKIFSSFPCPERHLEDGAGAGTRRGREGGRPDRVLRLLQGDV